MPTIPSVPSEEKPNVEQVQNVEILHLKKPPSPPLEALGAPLPVTPAVSVAGVLPEPVADPGDDGGDSYMAELAKRELEEALRFINTVPREAKKKEEEPAQGVKEVEGVVEGVAGVARDVGKGVIEAPIQAVGGVADAAAEVTQTIGNIIGDPVSGVVDFWEGMSRDIGQAKTVTGSVVRDVSQFMVGFLPALKAAKGLGLASKVMRTEGAAALGGAAVFDEHEARLSNIIQSHPSIANPITEYLAADPGDSVAEGKLKIALESAGLAAGAGAFGQAIKVIRDVRGGRAPVPGEKAAPDVEQVQIQKARLSAEESRVAFRKLGDPKAPLIRQGDIPEDQIQAWLRVSGVSDQKFAININLQRLNGPDDIKQAIVKTARAFEGSIDEARRGTIHREEMSRLANETGLTVGQLTARGVGTAGNPEEILASRRILASSGELLMQLRAAAAGADSSNIDKAAFRSHLATHVDIQKAVSGLAAEWGRAGTAFKIPVGENQAKAIKEYVEASGGAEHIDDIAEKMLQLETPDQINQFAKQADKARPGDMVLEAWINALLSGPQTHAVNITSNALFNLWQVPERWLASKIGSGVESGEATALAFGMMNGMRDGFSLAAKTMRTGEPSSPLAKIEARKFKAISAANLELSGPLGRAVDVLGNVIRTPGRALMAEDEFFKSVAYRGELQAHAWREASREGLKGDEFAKKVQAIIRDPPEHIKLAAQDASNYATFTKELGVGGKLFQRIVSEHPALRVITPFIRTPLNIMKAVGERTPLAFMSRAVRADIKAGGARRDLALARISLGSVSMAAFADLAGQGVITGAGPPDPELKAILRRKGIPAYSIRIGDRWHAYNRLDPVGSLMGLAADMAGVMGQLNDADASELAGAAVLSIAQNMTNKTFMAGLSETISVLNQVSPDVGITKGSQFISNLLGSAVPSFVAQKERRDDPAVRDVRPDPEASFGLLAEVLNKIKSRVPGWSQSLPPMRNLWGEIIMASPGLGPDIISPIYTSEEKPSPIDDELWRNQIQIEMPSRILEGVELTPSQYSRYVELAGNALKDNSGKGLKDSLNQVITEDRYLRRTDGPEGGKALILKNHVYRFRALAQRELKTEFPELDVKQMQRRHDRQMQLRGF